jgi:hypothetical protein
MPEKDGLRMLATQTNTDALLVAIPMVTVMFAAFFRLDEAFGRHDKPLENGHPLSHWDAEGQPVCIEPDGRRHCNPSHESKNKSRSKRTRIITPEWASDGDDNFEG